MTRESWFRQTNIITIISSLFTRTFGDRIPILIVRNLPRKLKRPTTFSHYNRSLPYRLFVIIFVTSFFIHFPP
ncbi:hypothetical protein Hanom_Chr04g00341721 [Helianthus anomalus]